MGAITLHEKAMVPVDQGWRNKKMDVTTALCVLASHETVLSTQRHQYTQCPS